METLTTNRSIVGGEWPSYAKNAALYLSRDKQETDNLSIELLIDIKKAFASKKSDRLSTERNGALTESAHIMQTAEEIVRAVALGQLSIKEGRELTALIDEQRQTIKSEKKSLKLDLFSR